MVKHILAPLVKLSLEKAAAIAPEQTQLVIVEPELDLEDILLSLLEAGVSVLQLNLSLQKAMLYRVSPMPIESIEDILRLFKQPEWN